MRREFLLFSIIGLLVGCAGQSPNGGTSEVDTAPSQASVADGTSAVMAEADPAAAGDVQMVKFETTQGDILIEVHPEWAPKGAARFLELVRSGYYDGVKWFRVLDGFMAQTGMAGDPQLNTKWKNQPITDDPVTKSNTRSYVTFATGGPDTRTTQIFINYADNSNLDSMGFAPFGKVVEGMDVVDKLYSGYGEGAPGGRGPSQAMIASEGNKYLEANFPKLDAIKKATVVESAPSSAAGAESSGGESDESGSTVEEE